MTDDNETPNNACWICGSVDSKCIKQGIDPHTLSADHFAITDASYGTTLSIHRCNSCGFLFCPDAGDVTGFYADLEDEEYENTREQRALQAKKLLQHIAPLQTAGSLLDIGAGSGILVEEAQSQGYQASGVEPSTWLVEKAKQRALPVTEGIFPDAIGDNLYEVITLIDVLEHVHTPQQLLNDISKRLSKDGMAVIVTPDVKSFAAGLLGKKWWHYRIAHISYFEKNTLKLALKNAGLEPVKWIRPAWFFPLDYLLLRLGQYIPFIDRLAKLKFTRSTTIPLNLFDSWMVVVRRTT